MNFNKLNNIRHRALEWLSVGVDEKYIQKDVKTKLYFFSTILFYIIYMLLTQSFWVFGGEMWAEMATNYYPNAYGTLYERFLSTDAGYIPLTQRIIAQIGAVLPISMKMIPFYYNWSTILITSIIIGSFNNKAFRNVIYSDNLRFSVAIITLFFGDFASRTFINFTGYAIFFNIVVVTYLLANENKRIPLWMWFMPLFMISKPTLLIFVPILMLLIVLPLKKGKVLALTSLIMGFLQFLRLSISENSGVWETPDRSIAKLLFVTIKDFFVLAGGILFRSLKQVLFALRIDDTLTQLLLALIGLFFTAFVLWALIKKKHMANRLICVSIAVSFLSNLLNVYTLPLWDTFVNRLGLVRYFFGNFFSIVLILSALLAISSEINTGLNKLINRKSVSLLMILWFFISGWPIISCKWNKLWLGNWQEVASETAKYDPSIFIVNSPIGFNLNSSEVFENNAFINGKNWHWNILPENNELEVPLNSYYSNKKLSGVGIVVRNNSKEQKEITVKGQITRDGKIIQENESKAKINKYGRISWIQFSKSIELKENDTIKIIFSKYNLQYMLPDVLEENDLPILIN